MLYIKEVPAIGTGGDTLFANMHLALDMLSPTMQGFLQGLTAVHDGSIPWKGYQAPEGLPKNEHPVVVRHPETGRKEPILTCRVRWEPNTLVFWDNRCTQHHAVWDYFPHSRYGERVTILGEQPQPWSET